MTSAPNERQRIRRRVRPSPTAPQITSIEVRGLFGKIDYPEIQISSGPKSTTHISVIFGDNGTGKTTILRLIYACLSPQPHMGLRTLLASTPFRAFRINLNIGHILVKKVDLTGAYTVDIDLGEIRGEFAVKPEPDGRVREQPAIAGLEDALHRLNFDILFVDHNRVVQSTYAFLSDLSTPNEGFQRTISDRQYLYLAHEAEFRAARRMQETDLQFPLPQVVDALEKSIRGLAFRQGAVGDQSAAAVYLEIVKSITRDRRKSSTSTPELEDVAAILAGLQSTTSSYIKHGLLSDYPFDDLIELYNSASKAKKEQIRSVLAPFLNSIQRRVAALENVHRLVTTFEHEIAKFLSEKHARLHILDGLKIEDERGALDLDSLSSGEKQLIFLLCAAAVARSKPSLIIIDEPELSLNYKWQRIIASSLMNISYGSDTQYILASHSVEIITRYVGSSFELIP